jgi:hypothetical protein
VDIAYLRQLLSAGNERDVVQLGKNIVNNEQGRILKLVIAITNVLVLKRFGKSFGLSFRNFNPLLNLPCLKGFFP